MAITFGSVGDIIATVQIAAQLLNVLSSSRGSTKEFGDVVVNLRAYHRALEFLVSDLQSRAQCPKLETLYNIIKPAVLDSQTAIADFLDSILLKYGTSLVHTTRYKRTWKTMGKMIQWHMFESDKIKELDTRICRNKNIIDLVLRNAQDISREQDQDLIRQRMDALIDLEAQISALIEERLDKLDDVISEINKEVKNVTTIVSPIADTTLEIRDLVTGMNQMLLTKAQVFEILHPYTQKPLLIEDALGWKIPIQLEVIKSWDSVHSILRDNFATKPGYALVKMKRYILTDELNGQQLEDLPLAMVARPGQQMNMSMVFSSEPENSNICLRCQTQMSFSSNLEWKCSNPICEMIIRRVSEVTSINDSEQAIIDEPKHLDDQPNDGRSIHIDDDVHEDLIHASEVEEGPEVFKRIQFFSRWEDRPESRGDLRFQVGSYFFWGSRCEAFQMMCYLEDILYPRSEKLFAGVQYGDFLVYGILFMGKSIIKSSPVVLIYSRDKKLVRRWMNLVAKIPWIKSNPRFLIANCSTKEFKEYFYKECPNPLETAKLEYEKWLKRQSLQEEKNLASNQLVCQ